MLYARHVAKSLMLRLDWCSHKAAKYAVEHWHYSQCMPVGKLIKIGVWEDNKFIGAVIFGRGANKSLFEPFGLSQTEGCELVRIALNKHKTEVTKIVKIALSMLKNNFDIKMVISFADPEQGHSGQIYKAGNWIYGGMTQGADEYIYNGKRWHGRAFRKTYGSHLNYDVEIVKGSRKHRFIMPLNKEIKSKMRELVKEQQTPSADGGVTPTLTLQTTKVA